MNDIININANAKCINYADDTSILFSANNANLLIDVAHLALFRLEMRSHDNVLQIIVIKIKAVLLRSTNKYVNIREKPNFKFN